MPPRRSSAPLWLTLGFAAGLAFGWMALRDDAPPPAAVKESAVTVASDRAEIPVNAGTLRAVEQTFERWGGYAVWENDVTEIAAWDARRKRHSDFYEVRRHDGKLYFRSLRALTRPLVDHGDGVTPVGFTEPQWMRDQFYREHPDYDPATAPHVDLPPRPPERFATDRSQPTPAGNTAPRKSDYSGNVSLTPGAGG